MSTPTTIPPDLLAELKASHIQTKAILCQTMDDYLKRIFTLLGAIPRESSAPEAEEAAPEPTEPLNLVYRPIDLSLKSGGGGSEVVATGHQVTSASIQPPPLPVLVPNESIKEEIIQEEEEVILLEEPPPPLPPASLDQPSNTEEEPSSIPNATTPATTDQILPIKQEVMSSVQVSEPRVTPPLPLPSPSIVNQEPELSVSNDRAVPQSPKQAIPAAAESPATTATTFQLTIHPNSAFSRPVALQSEPVVTTAPEANSSPATPKLTRRLSESANDPPPLATKRLCARSESQEATMDPNPGPSNYRLPTDIVLNAELTGKRLKKIPKKITTRSQSSSGPEEEPENAPEENPSTANGDTTSSEYSGPSFLTKYVNCLVEKCSEQFESAKARYQHTYLVHKVAPHECPLEGCTRRYDSSRQLLDHYTTEHTNLTGWRCRSCRRFFLTSKKLDRHYFLDHEPGRYLCPVGGCPFEATTRGDVISHFRANHPKPSKLKPEVPSTPIRTSSEQQKYLVVKWKCTHCPDSWFFTCHSLEQHLKDKHREAAFPCSVDGCKESFAVKSALKEHYQVEHTHLSSWKCVHCPREFPDGVQYSQHLFIAHTEGLFRCQQCSFEAFYRADVMDHFQRQHCESLSLKLPSEETTSTSGRFTISAIKCTHCPEWFIGNKDLSEHLKAKHGLLWFQCLASACGQSFSSKYQLMAHIKSVHAELSTWTCPKCEQSFMSSNVLHRHYYLSHYEGSFGCTRCSAKAKFKIQILEHWIQEHGDCDEVTENQDPPQEVAKVAKIPDDQKYHILTLKCPYCSYWCRSAPTLEDHLCGHHDISLFRCSLQWCVLNFKSRINLRDHLAEEHPEVTSWRCSQCLATFPNGLSLNEHDVHEHDEAFSEALAKSQEMTRIGSGGAFRCAVCQLKFTYKDDVIEHWNREHGEESEGGC